MAGLVFLWNRPKTGGGKLVQQPIIPTRPIPPPPWHTAPMWRAVLAVSSGVIR